MCYNYYMAAENEQSAFDKLMHTPMTRRVVVSGAAAAAASAVTAQAERKYGFIQRLFRGRAATSGRENTGQVSQTPPAEGALDIGGGYSTPTHEATPVVDPTATFTPEPTSTYTPTTESTPTATATNTPEPTATSTPTPEPTATYTVTPEVPYDQKVEKELPYELSVNKLTFTKESGELSYLSHITLGVDNYLTNDDGSCRFMDAISKECFSISRVDVNLNAFPGIRPEDARKFAAQRLEDAVLVSYTYSLHSQDPEKYGQLSVDDLKGMIESGQAPNLIFPKTMNSDSIEPKINSEVNYVENGLWIILTGPGKAGSLSFTPQFYVGIREELNAGILELTATDLFNVNKPERASSKLSSGIARGLQFMSDYKVINGDFGNPVPLERLQEEFDLFGGAQIKESLLPDGQGILIPSS